MVVAKANCGVPRVRGDSVEYSGTPELMADYARLARDAGARIIGGCCGTTPEHIRQLREALKNFKGKVHRGRIKHREKLDAAPLPVTEPSELAQKLGNKFVTDRKSVV